MINTSKDCKYCIHNKVCSIKDQAKEAKDKAFEIFGDGNELLDISVKCTQFSEGLTVRRSAGFD